MDVDLQQVSEALKTGGALALLGLVLFGLYRLVDRWAGKFLAVHQDQAEGVKKLAENLQDALDEQRESLIVQRIISNKMDRLMATQDAMRKEFVKELELLHRDMQDAKEVEL